MELVTQLLESDEARLQAIETGGAFLTGAAIGYFTRQSPEEIEREKAETKAQ